MARIEKDPDAVLDYGFNWATWLDGDTISASTWAISGEDSVLTKDSDSNTPTTTEIWLSSGTVGVEYTVTNHITTAAGREADRSLLFTIAQQ
jgi:hypothetical protein